VSNVTSKSDTHHIAKDGLGGMLLPASRLLVKEKAMSELLKYPQWQKPLMEAILEFDPERLSLKVRTLEKAMHARFDTLSGSHDSRERQALADGLATLDMLKESAHNLQQQ
jgi:hypothetical protein